MPREVSVELAADIATLIKAQLGCQRLLGRSEKCVLATPLVISNKKKKVTIEGLSSELSQYVFKAIELLHC